MRTIHVGNIPIGLDQPLTIIGGPCLAESQELCMTVAETMRDACAAVGLSYVFKASFDKANRSSIHSQRGPGLDTAMQWFSHVRHKAGVPVTTDIHEPSQAAAVGQVVDLIQIPAFLCRQTDLLVAAAQTGKPVNVKKGQFMSPAEMTNVVAKLTETAGDDAAIMLTERGTFFGYHRLVNDFIGLGDLQELGWPICFDATHSTQQPGGASGGLTSGGRPDRAPLLARCAVVAGVAAVFLETHPDPEHALSDRETMLDLETTQSLLGDLARLYEVVQGGVER